MCSLAHVFHTLLTTQSLHSWILAQILYTQTHEPYDHEHIHSDCVTIENGNDDNDDDNNNDRKSKQFNQTMEIFVYHWML